MEGWSLYLWQIKRFCSHTHTYTHTLRPTPEDGSKIFTKCQILKAFKRKLYFENISISTFSCLKRDSEIYPRFKINVTSCGIEIQAKFFSFLCESEKRILNLSFASFWTNAVSMGHPSQRRKRECEQIKQTTQLMEQKYDISTSKYNKITK